jgi:hypothetical protein
MNKTMKIALCIGLTGLVMFVWTHSAAAGKPAKAPVVVTFLSGDVSAAPQTLGGPFTASIDFTRHLAYPAGKSIANWQDLLNSLQARNPITYDSLIIAVSKGGPLYSGLYFAVTLDGVPYTISLRTFQAGTTEVTATLDTMHWSQGGMRIMSGKNQLFEAGCYGGQTSVDFTMTK